MRRGLEHTADGPLSRPRTTYSIHRTNDWTYQYQREHGDLIGMARRTDRLRQTEESSAESIRGGPLSEDRLLKGGAKDRFANDKASPT
jgi:hypothetical protein